MSQAVALAALCVLVTATVLPLQSVFGEGGARRDVIHAEEQHRQEAITLAQEAADHGKQGHVGALLTATVCLKAGETPHVDAGIGELKQAIEHGKAGHADVATGADRLTQNRCDAIPAEGGGASVLYSAHA